MNRRSFVLLTPVSAMTTHAAQSALVIRSNRIQIPITSDQVIQQMHCSSDQLYTLALDRRDGSVSLLTCRCDGTEVRQVPFPGNNLISSLYVDLKQQVSVIAMSRSQRLRELWQVNPASEKFENAGPVSDDKPCLGHFVVAGRICLLTGGGGHPMRTTGTKSTSWIASIPTLSDYSIAYPLDYSRALIVDRARGALFSFDGNSRRAAEAIIDAPEIRSALKYFKEYPLRTNSPTTPPGFLIGAHSLTETNSFAFLCAPIRREQGGTILVTSIEGTVQKRARISLPSRDDQPTIPRYLGAVGKRLVLIYPKGAVDSYVLE